MLNPDGYVQTYSGLDIGPACVLGDIVGCQVVDELVDDLSGAHVAQERQSQSVLARPLGQVLLGCRLEQELRL